MLSKDDLKKYAAGAAIASALSGGAYLAGDTLSGCKHFVMHNEEKICIDADVDAAIRGAVGVSKGFGGIKMGGE